MVSRLKPNSKSYNKSSHGNDNITIDAKHSEMISYFKNLHDSIPMLKEELKKIILEYNNKDINRKNDIDYILYRDNLKEKINEIKNKITGINNNDEINKYYLNVGSLLHSYYENVENSKNDENNSENFENNLINYDDLSDDLTEDLLSDEDENLDEDNTKKDNNNYNYKSVVNFFNNREENDIKSEKTEITDINQEGVYASLKISDFVKEELTFKKKNILDEYLKKIDPGYIPRINIDYNICKCSVCKLEMTLYPSEGYQICEGCGYQQNILIESDKPSFKDPPMEVCYFSYKRINHLNELAIDDKKYINECILKFNLLTKIKKLIFILSELLF